MYTPTYTAFWLLGVAYLTGDVQWAAVHVIGIMPRWTAHRRSLASARAQTGLHLDVGGSKMTQSTVPWHCCIGMANGRAAGLSTTTMRHAGGLVAETKERLWKPLPVQCGLQDSLSAGQRDLLP